MRTLIDHIVLVSVEVTEWQPIAGLVGMVEDRVSTHMDEITRNFKPGAKITVLVRTPGNDEADFCMTDDDLAEVAKMVQRRADADTTKRQNPPRCPACTGAAQNHALDCPERPPGPSNPPRPVPPRYGFTLVEALITLCLMAIFGGICGAIYSHYREQKDAKEPTPEQVEAQQWKRIGGIPTSSELVVLPTGERVLILFRKGSYENTMAAVLLPPLPVREVER